MLRKFESYLLREDAKERVLKIFRSEDFKRCPISFIRKAISEPYPANPDENEPSLFRGSRGDLYIVLRDCIFLAKIGKIVPESFFVRECNADVRDFELKFGKVFVSYREEESLLFNSVRMMTAVGLSHDNG